MARLAVLWTLSLLVGPSSSTTSCAHGDFSCSGGPDRHSTIYQCDWGLWTDLGRFPACGVQGSVPSQFPSTATSTTPSSSTERIPSVLSDWTTSRPSPSTRLTESVASATAMTRWDHGGSSQVASSKSWPSKMASTYDADCSSSFRCPEGSLCCPVDGMFAAVWTPYNASVTGFQTNEPHDCCSTLVVANAKDSTRHVRVTVVDRCCSCVGTHRSYGLDPTCGDFTPNGATIDLSPIAFYTLFGEHTGVFDVIYDGSPWPGSLDEPSPVRASTG